MVDHSIKGKTVLVTGGAKNLRADRPRSRRPRREGHRHPLQQRREQGRRRRHRRRAAAPGQGGSAAGRSHQRRGHGKAVRRRHRRGGQAGHRHQHRRQGVEEAFHRDQRGRIRRDERGQCQICVLLPARSRQARQRQRQDLHPGDLLLGAYTPYYAAYAGTKAPVEHFTRAASKEFGARGISVTAVGPGPMDTPFFYPPRAPTRWPTTRPQRRCRPSPGPA